MRGLAVWMARRRPRSSMVRACPCPNPRLTRTIAPSGTPATARVRIPRRQRTRRTVSGGAGRTITRIGRAVPRFPLESVTSALSRCVPGAAASAIHCVRNGACSTGRPRGRPSSRNCTERTTAGGLADALASSVTAPETPAPARGKVTVRLRVNRRKGELIVAGRSELADGGERDPAIERPHPWPRNAVEGLDEGGDAGARVVGRVDLERPRSDIRRDVGERSSRTPEPGSTPTEISPVGTRILRSGGASRPDGAAVDVPAAAVGNTTTVNTIRGPSVLRPSELMRLLIGGHARSP